MKTLVFFILFISSFLCHSQIIDQQVIPFPRRVNDIKLVIHTSFPNSTQRDSFDVALDTISNEVLINGYYTNGFWPSPCVAIDTFDLSNYMEPGNYKIKFIEKLYILDTLTVLYDSITHRITIEPSLFVSNNEINVSCVVFPNPTDAFINIVLNTKNKLNDVQYVLLNNQGVSVISFNKSHIDAGEEFTQISLLDVKPGTYILVLKAANERIYRKVIKL